MNVWPGPSTKEPEILEARDKMFLIALILRNADKPPIPLRAATVNPLPTLPFLDVAHFFR